MVDILATASPLICVGSLVGIYVDNVAVVLVAQTIMTAILALAASLGSLLGRQTTE
jgi:uncharacterized membrane protein (UPF0136 family)